MKIGRICGLTHTEAIGLGKGGIYNSFVIPTPHEGERAIEDT